uniref:Uncharacterized protein n=1 Tax=Rhizophora mucronata TaxID=61149 RepID=A0A2P2PFV0_RHIMU
MVVTESSFFEPSKRPLSLSIEFLFASLLATKDSILFYIDVTCKRFTWDIKSHFPLSILAAQTRKKERTLYFTK